MSSFYDFEAWLTEHLPEVVSDLNPGATEGELEAFASKLNIVLPEQFKALYRWHNGQRMDVNSGPWYGLNFIPLSKVLSECESWAESLSTSSPESLISL